MKSAAAWALLGIAAAALVAAVALWSGGSNPENPPRLPENASAPEPRKLPEDHAIHPATEAAPPPEGREAPKTDRPPTADERRLQGVLETWIRSQSLPHGHHPCPLPGGTRVLAVRYDADDQRLRLEFSKEALEQLADDLWADDLIHSLWEVVEPELPEARHLHVYMQGPDGRTRLMQDYQAELEGS